MRKVVFCGDEPSSKNISTDIAFVGANCFERLISWIEYIKPNYYICLNTDTVGQLSDIRKLQKNGFKVIALGKKASDRIKDIPHKKINHPSGLNRSNNDLIKIENMLEDVKAYIRS